MHEQQNTHCSQLPKDLALQTRTQTCAVLLPNSSVDQVGVAQPIWTLKKAIENQKGSPSLLGITTG